MFGIVHSMMSSATMVPLDPIGNISLILQVTILFLLILGLPFVRGKDGKKNLMRHGYSTIAALILHSILILLVMIPVFSNGIPELSDLSIFSSITVYSHIILGSLAEILGLIIVIFWFGKPLVNMACLKFKKIMLPLFIIWIIALINGSIIHVFGLL